ncbi:MAG: hypothetical protein KBT30_02460 [Clostridiales bacterium]|nr:hypothetical protein [Candidatus Apopatousia equi]
METENDILIEPETETMKPVAYSEVITDDNEQINKEYKRFTDYSNEKQKKDYEEFEIVQTYTPKKKTKKKSEFDELVDSQNSYIPANETYIYEKTKTKPTRKRVSKIFIAICCAIVLLMGTLGIVNAVKMAELEKNIATTTSEITNIGSVISKIDDDIEGMVNEVEVKKQAELNDYVEITNRKEIELNEKNVVEEYKGTSNIFDIICNFLMKLFGG